MRYTMFSEKDNTLYIRTEVLLPKNGTKEDIRKAFQMTYEERLERYCPAEIKAGIKQEISAHKGCRISEFTS